MSEFIGLDPDEIPYVVTEAAGPLLVWYHGLVLASFPWHSHAHVDERGALHIFDLITGRQVKEYTKGDWTAVRHQA